MVLDHISISGSMPDCPDSCVYRIRAELKEMPEVNWQEGLRFIWCNSPFYLCKKSDLIMGGNEIQLLLTTATIFKMPLTLGERNRKSR